MAFRKYEKTYRIPIPQLPRLGKLYLSARETKLLLAGKVYVQEKMDGANTGIVRTKRGFHLQKRNSLVGPSEHQCFQRFHAWANKDAWDRIMSLHPGFVVYGEWLYALHSLRYDGLPDYFLVFDVWDGSKYLDVPEVEDFCDEHGFHQVPVLDVGHFSRVHLWGLVPDRSAYGPACEGIVVKRYRKGQALRGKVVRPEFLQKVDESEDHWTRRRVVVNQVAGRTEHPPRW